MIFSLLHEKVCSNIFLFRETNSGRHGSFIGFSPYHDKMFFACKLSTSRFHVLCVFPMLSSLTRWLDYFLNVWPLTTMKSCEIGSTKIAKVGSKFWKLLNKSSKNCTSSEISENLVNLPMSNRYRIVA